MSASLTWGEGTRGCKGRRGSWTWSRRGERRRSKTRSASCTCVCTQIFTSSKGSSRYHCISSKQNMVEVIAWLTHQMSDTLVWSHHPRLGRLQPETKASDYSPPCFLSCSIICCSWPRHDLTRWQDNAERLTLYVAGIERRRETEMTPTASPK